MKYKGIYARKGKRIVEHDLACKAVYELLKFIEEHEEYELISIELEEEY